VLVPPPVDLVWHSPAPAAGATPESPSRSLRRFKWIYQRKMVLSKLNNQQYILSGLKLKALIIIIIRTATLFSLWSNPTAVCTWASLFFVPFRSGDAKQDQGLVDDHAIETFGSTRPVQGGNFYSAAGCQLG